MATLLVFLLPWQTRWIYHPVKLNGSFWEYGTQSLYATEVLLWLIIILFAIGQFSRREFWSKVFRKKPSRYYWPVAALVAVYMALQVFGHAHPEITTEFIFHLLEAACFFVILTYLLKEERAAFPLSLALWLAGVGQALVGLSQFAAQEVYPNKWLGLAYQSPFQPGSGVIDAPLGHILRAYGSLGGPNPFGIFLAVIYVFGLLLYMKRPSIWLLAGQAVIASGLIVSFSRAGWLAGAVGTITLAIFLYRRRAALALRSVVKQSAMAILLAAVAFVWLLPAFTTRLIPTATLEQYSINDRMEQYTAAFSLAPADWLFGAGLGLYTYQLYRLNPHAPGWQYQPIHDAYVLLASEGGLVGALLFALFVYWLIKKIWAVNPFYVAVLITLATASLFEHFMWSLYVGQLFSWTIFAFGFQKKIDS